MSMATAEVAQRCWCMPFSLLQIKYIVFVGGNTAGTDDIKDAPNNSKNPRKAISAKKPV